MTDSELAELSDHLKDHLADYITSKGGNLGEAHGKEGVRKSLCILHNEKTPSFTYNPKKRLFYCFGCHKGGDLFSLISYMEGTDRKGAWKRAMELYGSKYTFPENGAIKSPRRPLKDQRGEVYQKPAASVSRGISEAVASNGGEVDEEKVKSIAEARKILLKAQAKAAERPPEAVKYLEEVRKISYDFALYQGMGYLDGWIYFPAGETWQRRSIKGKEYKWAPGGGSDIFNRDRLDDEKVGPLFVVEGPFDMLSVEQAGYDAIALSTSHQKNLLELIDQGHRGPADRIYILSLDNDHADPPVYDAEGVEVRGEGQKANAELKAELEKRGIKAVEINIAGTMPGEPKDANEALVKLGEDAFSHRVAQVIEDAMKEQMEEVRAKKEKYEECRADRRLSVFLEKAKEGKRRGIATGFRYLNEVLGGGFYTGLYILGAKPGQGKTTYALQVADSMAKKGQDVLFFTLEMAADDLMAKSLNRTEYEIKSPHDINNILTAREILLGERYSLQGKEVLYRPYNEAERALRDKATKDYISYAGRLYFVEKMIRADGPISASSSVNAKDIRAKVEEHIKTEGTRPVVFVDYLQKIASFLPAGSTDLQILDATVSELKSIALDFNIPVIAISSLNRSGYDGKTGMAGFKGSSEIEFTADVLLRLRKKGDKDGDGLEVIDISEGGLGNQMEIEVEKARIGDTGILEYTFEGKYSHYRETGYKTWMDIENEKAKKGKAAKSAPSWKKGK